MTLTTTINRNDYTATGGQTIFAYQFRILANTDLQVYVNKVLKTLTTDYTVSGVGVATGGNVTFGTGLTAGDLVLIIRVEPLTQSTDYTASGPFPAETHEQALDKLTMQVQDMDEKQGRNVKFPVTSTLSDIDFPAGTSATDRANKIPAWNTAGTDLELVTPTSVDSVSLIAVKGDLIQGGNTGNAEKLAIGTNDDTLQVVGGKAAWTNQPVVADFTNATHDHADAAGGGNTLTAPTIANFTNAGHNHSNAANGGTLGDITLGQIAVTDATFSGSAAATPDANTITKDHLIGARCTFNGTGTPAYIEEINFSGAITDNGTGDYTLTIDRDFANANYTVHVTSGAGSQIGGVGTVAVGSVQVKIVLDTGAATDNARINVICVGAQ